MFMLEYVLILKFSMLSLFDAIYIRHMTPKKCQCKVTPSRATVVSMSATSHPRRVAQIGRELTNATEMFDVVFSIEGVHGAVVIDFHCEQNLLFYGDVKADAIKRVNMKNFYDVKTIVSTSSSSVLSGTDTSSRRVCADSSVSSRRCCSCTRRHSTLLKYAPLSRPSSF
jgi:hypothetical protein